MFSFPFISGDNLSWRLIPRGRAGGFRDVGWNSVLFAEVIDGERFTCAGDHAKAFARFERFDVSSLYVPEREVINEPDKFGRRRRSELGQVGRRRYRSPVGYRGRVRRGMQAGNFFE